MDGLPDLERLKNEFKEELTGISDIETLKDLYATEIAKRDKLILELQEQNKIILQSAFNQKKQG